MTFDLSRSKIKNKHFTTLPPAEKPTFVCSCLELHAPRKFVVEPTNHRKLNIDVKITFPVDSFKILAPITQKGRKIIE